MNLHSTASSLNGIVSFCVAFTQEELYHTLSKGEFIEFSHLYASGKHREALLFVLKAMEKGPGTSEQRAPARKPTEKTENGAVSAGSKDDQHYLG